MILENDDTQAQETTGLEAIAQESPEEVVSVEQTPTEQQVADQKELNFKALRESKERAERERDEAFRKLQEVARLQQEAQQAQQYEEEEEEPQLNPDDLVEWKHVQKKMQNLERKLQAYQQQSNEITIESRLKSQYSDFDKVVSRDNVEALKNSYPELFQTIHSSPDLYSKGVTAYTMIKKLGIQPEDFYEQDRALAQRNAAKPRPLASVAPQQGDSPLSKANAFANGLTEDMKKRLHKEMIDSMKGV